MQVLGAAEVIADRERLRPGEDGRSGVALLVGGVEIAVVAFEVKDRLLRLELRLLQAEDVRLFLVDIFQKALGQTRPQTVDVPACELHTASSMGIFSPLYHTRRKRQMPFFRNRHSPFAEGVSLRSAPRLAMPASDARSAQRIFRDVQAAAKYGLEFFRSLQAANSVRPPWIRPRRGSEGSRAVVLSLWFAVMADLLRVLDRGLCR